MIPAAIILTVVTALALAWPLLRPRGGSGGGKVRHRVLAVAVGALLAVVAGTVYRGTGTPGTPDFPLAARSGGPASPAGAAIADLPEAERLQAIEGMVAGLAARLEANPDDPAGWRRLGRSYLVLGRTEAGIAALAEAARRAPESVDILLDYAHALVPPGQPAAELPPEFIEVMHQVHAVAPDNPEGLFFVGLAAAAAGDTATARRLWTRLRELLGDDSPVAAAIDQRLEALGSPPE